MEITVLSAKNMLFTVSAFVYSFLTLLVFLKKKKVMTFENTTYVFVLSCVVIQLLTSIFVFSINIPWLSLLLRRLHHALFIIWGFALMYYFLVVVSKKNQGYVSIKDNSKKEYFMKMLYIVGGIGLVASSLIFILPYNPVNGLYITAKGPAATYGYSVFGILIAILFVLFFRADKKEYPVSKEYGIDRCSV